MKKQLEISSLYTSVPKIMIICYTGPEIWCVMHVIIFHFGSFFALLPPLSLTAWKIKILQKWKRHLEIYSFYKCSKKNNWRYHHFRYVYQKLWSDDGRFLRYGAWQTDGRTDGKSDIQRWVPHLKKEASKEVNKSLFNTLCISRLVFHQGFSLVKSCLMMHN